MALKDLIREDIAAKRPKTLAQQAAEKLRQLIPLEKLESC